MYFLKIDKKKNIPAKTALLLWLLPGPPSPGPIALSGLHLATNELRSSQGGTSTTDGLLASLPSDVHTDILNSP